MSDMVRFIKRWAVYSKTADAPVVALHGSNAYVFVRGYPMSYRTFVSLAMKSVLGGGVSLKGYHWEEIHNEVRELCKDLPHVLYKDHPGHVIVEEIRKLLKVTKEYDRQTIANWLVDIDEQLQTATKGS